MANRKLGRTTDIRLAMLKSLTTDLFVYGKITTTESTIDFNSLALASVVTTLPFKIMSVVNDLSIANL